MAEFNLIEEPWVPCIDLQGRQAEYGIRDTLRRAHELREIYDDSPLVTVGLYRLLLAILYRAHNGPRTFADWNALYRIGAFAPATLAGYFGRWTGRFDLYCSHYPFYQMAGLETQSAVSINRLATECASGNNATLFDHCGDDEEANWGPALVAKQLVASQAFALGFGKSGNARINGKPEALPYAADAIALRGMSIWLEGASLFETLMINLAPVNDESLPPWEMDDPHQYRDRIDGKGRRAVASRGVVDRLTWQSRLVRLLPDGQACSKMYFTQGRSADKSRGDPMKVYRMSKEHGVFPLPLNSARSAWRDIHAILMVPPPGSNEQRPECLNLVARAGLTGSLVTHVVGLASPPGKAGKFLLWRHERMPVHTFLLGNNDMIGRLGALVENAKQAAEALKTRVRWMARLFLAPDAKTSNGRQPDKDAVTKLAEAIDPRPAYWARMEQHFYGLLERLPTDWDEAGGDWKPDAEQTATNAWRQQIKDEAQHALKESIRALGTTARALQAIARVRTDFHDRDLRPRQQSPEAKKKGGKRNEP